MTQDDLLSTLRGLTTETEPSELSKLVTQLEHLNNHLSDIKDKLNVSNELQMNYQWWLREGGRSDFASQARPIKNVPRSQQIRRWNGNNYG